MATRAAQAPTVVWAALVLTGILATVALGESCEEAVEGNGTRYVGVGTTHAGPGRGSLLGEGELAGPLADRIEPAAG